MKNGKSPRVGVKLIVNVVFFKLTFGLAGFVKKFDIPEAVMLIKVIKPFGLGSETETVIDCAKDWLKSTLKGLSTNCIIGGTEAFIF